MLLLKDGNDDKEDEEGDDKDDDESDEDGDRGCNESDCGWERDEDERREWCWVCNE